MDSPPFGSRARAARQEERYSRCGNRLVLRAKRGTRLDVLSWLGAPLRLSVILVRFIASNALALIPRPGEAPPHSPELRPPLSPELSEPETTTGPSCESPVGTKSSALAA